MKNFVGVLLLVSGLILLIVGYSVSGGEVTTLEAIDQEITVKNSSAENFNWRSFLGGLIAFIGFGIAIFPSQKTINEGRFD